MPRRVRRGVWTEAARIRRREKKNKRRSAAIAYLGGRCVSCSSTERLEFDHVDPGSRSFWISQGLAKAEEVFWAEVEKCQLLCRPCHIDKCRDEGTLTMGSKKKSCVGMQADKASAL